MPAKRVRESLDLARNPIVLALGQVITSPVLEIETFVPQLQERLRRSGYPLFERVDLQSIQLGPNQSATVQSESKWIFLDKDRTRSISIGQSFIVLEQNRYESFDAFVSIFEEALTSIADCVGPGLVQRLGFRRISLVDGSPSLPADKFIHETMLGVQSERFALAGQHHYEFRGETDQGNLMVRVVRPAPQGVLPPELTGTALLIRQPEDPHNSATIDIDHFTVVNSDFDPVQISQGFWRLHDASDQAFRETVTNEALNHWSERHD